MKVGKAGTALKADNEYAHAHALFFTNAIISYEKKRLDKWLDDLITKNTLLGGSLNGFILGGKFIDNGQATSEEKILFRPVVPELNKEVLAYKKAKAAYDDEFTRLKQSFYTLLYPCQDQQDIRDALPEHVYHAMNMQWDLDRTRPEAYTVPNNPIKQFEYAQLLDLLDLHLSARML